MILHARPKSQNDFCSFRRVIWLLTPRFKQLYLFIPLEARLQPNIGFTLERVLTVFTRSDTTPPKVNRFRWNFEHSEHIVRGWPWPILGAIRPLAKAGKPGEVLFFCQVNNARLYRFPVGQISRNLNTTRTRIGVAMNPFGKQFWKFSRKGSFFWKKNKKSEIYLQRLASSGRHNSALIIDRRKCITKWSLCGILVSIFTARRNARIASAVLAIAFSSVCPSVRPSVCLTHAGIVSKRRHVARCSLHCQIAKCV